MKHAFHFILPTFLLMLNIGISQNSQSFFEDQQPKGLKTAVKYADSRSIKRIQSERRIAKLDPGSVYSMNDSIIYVYNSNSQVIEQQGRRFVNGAWQTLYRWLILEYDANGNPASQVYQTTIDGGSTWKNIDKYLIMFNQAGQQTQWVSQFWNETDQIWQTGTELNFEYDLNGNLTLQTSTSGANWKTEYIYNTHGNIVEQITYSAINTTVWSPYSVRTFNYNPSTELLNYSLGQDYDQFSNEWIATDSTRYEYGQGGVTQIDQYAYVGCKLLDRHIYTYNAANQLLKIRYQQACTLQDSLQFFELGDHQYEYDNDGDLLRSIQTSVSNNDTIIYELRFSYEVLSATSGYASPEDMFQIYPNPASGVAIMHVRNAVKTSTAYLFNNEGKRIETIQLNGESEHKINVGHLPKGIYYLGIPKENGGFEAKPFIVGYD